MQEQQWCNASSLRQDSLAYSVSDADSMCSDFADESFETYCDRMDTKEVVVIFDAFHPLVQQEVVVREGQAIDAMMEQIKTIRLSSSQDPAKNANDKAWQRRTQRNGANKENRAGVHGAFHAQRNAQIAS